MSNNLNPESSSDNGVLIGLPLFPTMDEAIEMAAKHLPPGYVIAIRVEKNGYGVGLEDREGNEIDLDGGDGMRSDVYAGIMQANGLPY